MPYAGRTTAACESCGEKPGRYGREKGKVCDACQALLADGRRIREHNAADHATAGYQLVPASHAIDAGHNERVQKALLRLARLVSEPAGVDYNANPLLDVSDGMHNWLSAAENRRARIDVAEALLETQRAVREATQLAYDRGKKDGARVLQRLASGDITLDSFDETLESSLERRKREGRG